MTCRHATLIVWLTTFCACPRVGCGANPGVAQADSVPVSSTGDTGTAASDGTLTAIEQLALLEREYAEQRHEFQQRISRAAASHERELLLAEMKTRQQSFNARFLSVADAYPATDEAASALIWIIANDFRDSPDSRQAMDLLIRDHLNDQRLSDICRLLATWAPSVDAERFLRSAVQSDNRHVQGYAKFCLAQFLRTDPARQSEVELVLGEIATSYSDVPGFRGTLGDSAAATLFELSQLGIGKIAPEIAGNDLTGLPLKLTDFRGQVVLLTFWGSWCPRCIDNLPMEHELQERMQGKPFALVGVANDSDIELAQQFVTDHRIDWRSWFDGDMTSGPIAAQWNVLEWPMSYLIDHNGVICAKFNGPLPTGLDRAIDQLIAAVPATAEKSRAWIWLLGGGVICILCAAMHRWSNRVPGAVKF